MWAVILFQLFRSLELAGPSAGQLMRRISIALTHGMWAWALFTHLNQINMHIVNVQSIKLQE